MVIVMAVAIMWCRLGWYTMTTNRYL